MLCLVRLASDRFRFDLPAQLVCHSACIIGQACAVTPVIGREGPLRLVGWAGKLRARDRAGGGRRGRCGHGHLPQMAALTSVPDGELWRSFPEANRSDILGLLSMLLERWAVSAGLAAEGTGGEHGAAG